MLIYAVIALLVLILVVLVALVLTSPSRGRDGGEETCLTPERIRALALSLSKPGKAGRTPSQMTELTSAARAYMRAKKKAKSGVKLERCEKILLDDYHKMTSKISKRGYGELASLPHCGKARVCVLAKSILSSCKWRVDGAKIKEYVGEFMRYTPLTYPEICALRTAFEAETVAKLGAIARKITEIDRSRESAASDVQPDKRRSKKDGYLYWFTHGGKRADPRYVYRDAQIDEASVRLSYMALTSELADSLEGVSQTLSELGSTFNAEFTASLCPCAGLLEEDDVFAHTDVRSRLAYHARIYELSRALSSTERSVAGAALALGKERDCHFGTVLFDRADLIKAKLRFSKPRLAGSGSEVRARLFATAVFVLAAAAAVVPSLFAPNAGVGIAYALCCFAAFFPIAEYAVRIVAMRFSGSRPSPVLVGVPVTESDKTDVVMPVLVSDEKDARAAAERLLSIRAVNISEHVDYCLLCDLRASDSPTEPEDGRLIAALKEYEKEGLRLFVRRRVREGKRYRGKERKRGALRAYAEYRLECKGDEFVYITPHDAPKTIYTIVLDEDNALYPGGVRTAIDSIRHPFAAKYDLLTFTAKPDVGRADTRYALRGIGGGGGYAEHSDFYYDMTARAVFCGKGIFRLKEFYVKTGSLPVKRLLSHDIAEGAVSDTGAANVVTLERPPRGICSDHAREERWKRGDVLLLGLLARRYKLHPTYKYLVFSNAFSLFAPIAAYILVSAFFAYGGIWQAAAALFACFAKPLAEAAFAAFSSAGKRKLSVIGRAGGILLRAAEDFALLPVRAANAFLLLVRCAISAAADGEGLTAWRTFASVKGEKVSALGRYALPGTLLAVAVAAVAYHNFAFSMWALACVCAVFAVYSLAFVPTKTRYSAKRCEKDAAYGYIRATCAYFELLGSDDLACDNVQLYPPNGKSPTTSPTDLGFWLLADVCAAQTGASSAERALASLEKKLEMVERLPKFRGHLYNWYSVRGEIVPPKYVSFVDSGNFAAALITVKGFCEVSGADMLAARVKKLIDAIDFEYFFDREKGLFRRGWDDAARVFDGHYDLLASEARLAVYIGCAKTGNAAAWQSMGRSRLGAISPALASWSGTAFEYLMPELFLSTPAATELYASAIRAVKIQKKRKCRGFWGISESGYYAFDADGNYQYKAHGIADLALSGAKNECVISPYSSALAVLVDPKAAMEELAALREYGAYSAYGFYEAIDFSCGEHTVYSHMTHHQGMALCALTEFVTGGKLKELFGTDRSMSGAKVLLSEPVSDAAATKRIKSGFDYCRRSDAYADVSVLGEFPKVRLECGGEYGLAIDDCGRGYSFFGSDTVNVFRGDRYRDDGAFGLFLSEDGKACSPTFAPLCKDVNARVVYTRDGSEYTSGAASLKICVPPGLGGEVRRYEIRNDGDKAAEYRFVYYERLALAPRAAYAAHPCFEDLFVGTSFDKKRNAIVAERRSREKSGGLYAALAVIGAEIVPDCDAAHFNGLRFGEYTPPDKEVTGDTLAPCFGGSCTLRVKAGESASVTVVKFCARSREALDDKLEMLGRPDFAEYASKSVKDGGVLDKYADNAEGRNILYSLASQLMYRAMPKSAVLSGLISADSEANRIAGGKKTVVLRYGDCENYSAWVKACAACAVARIDFVLAIIYKEEDLYAETVKRALIDESGISDLDRLHFVRLVDVRGKSRLEAELTAGAFLIGGGEAKTPSRTSGIAQVISRSDGERALPDLYPCGAGGFDARGDYTVTRRPEKPYSNVICGKKGGVVVTQNGGGFCYFGSSYFGKTAPWDNDFSADGPFEELRVAVNGCGGRINKLRRGGYVVHSPGATVFCSRIDGVDFDVLRSSAADGALSVTAVDAENVSGEEKELTAFYAIRPSLDNADGSAFCACTEENGIIRAVNCNTGKRVFAATVGVRSECATDMSLYRSRLSREPVREGATSDHDEPLIGFRVRFTLAARGKKRFYIVMSEDEELLRAQTEQSLENGIAETKAYFSSLNPIAVDSGDKALDILYNRWLCPQIVSSRLNGRCGYYQAGGAVGLRDRLQDSLALLWLDPDEAAENIIDACAHQYAEGDAMHWWHPPKTGVRTKISDDKLFIPYLVSQYVLATGDRALLDEKTDYLVSAPLSGPAEARYEDPSYAGEPASVRDHCERAIASASATGRHGLLKIGGGDWNDALNAAGTLGIGESVWLTEFAVRVLRDYAETVGYEEGQRFLEQAQKLSAAAEKTFADGRFARAFTDGGEWLGKADSDVCRCDLICQAWAQIASIGGAAERASALDAARRLLYDEKTGIAKLLDPPFDKRRYFGYISAYPAGVRENGGQYTHAAVWYLLALAKAGRKEEALGLLRELNPVVRAAKYGGYKGEPYVLAADVYSAEGKEGEAGWTWYTGSAAWMYKTLTEEIFGLKMKNGLLCVGRPLTNDPERLKLSYRFKGTEYVISYVRGDGDYIRADGVNYLNCTEFRPEPAKGKVALVRVFAE